MKKKAAQEEVPSGIISRWSNFFIERYKTTILVIVALIFAGVFGAMNNQRQDFPSIPSNFIGVQVVYPGASAADIEREAIIPIEQALTEIDGVSSMRSSAGDNFGNVTLEMSDVEGTEDTVQEVEKVISRTSLPADAETSVDIFDVVGPSGVYTLASETRSKEEILEYAEDIRTELLLASSEIKEIEIIPENEYSVTIEYNAETLSDKGLSGQQFTQAIQSAIGSIPGGFVENGEGEQLSISVNASIQSLEDLGNVEVEDVKLSEVATIVREPKDIETISYAGVTVGDEVISTDGVYLFIYKKDDGDVIRIAEALEEKTVEINDSSMLPSDITLYEVYDNSGYVEDQIKALIDNGWLGLILILLVLMLFINLRTGIVVAAIIPMAFLGTLGILFAIGFSINILTLFGLLLVLGILVDNAIVIAEGVVHGIESGQSKVEAVKDTMKNLGPAVTAATMTTVVVFIPFASIGGLVGAFLKYIPYTIIIMLLMSYFLAITVTPVLSRFILKEETRDDRNNRELKTWEKVTILPAVVWYAQQAIDWLEDAYTTLGQKIYSNFWTRLLVVIIAFGLIVGSISTFATQLGVEQFPSSDGNVIALNFDFPAESSFEIQNDAVRRIMEKAVAADHLQSYFLIGGQVQMVFDDPEDRPEGNDIEAVEKQVEELIAAEAEAVFNDTGVEVEAQALGAGPPAASFDVIVELRGTDGAVLETAANDVVTFLNNQEDVIEVTNAYNESLVSGIEVAFRSDDLREKGISAQQANFAVRGIFAEETIGSIITRTDGISDDVIARYSEESTNEITDVEDVLVGVNTNSFPPEEVRLRDVADVRTVEKPSSISRLDGKRFIAINAMVDEEADPAIVEQAVKEYLSEEKVEELGLRADDIVYGGFTASNDENFANLTLVFLLAILAVYLILVYQFNSFIQPGLIMFTVPMALIGVFPGLLAVGSTINMISGLGIVALVGIVVNDAIVFVDYYNRIKKQNEKWDSVRVIIETGRARFKPILSTSITTIFGILPLTINDPFWQGLGTSLITGLICSTIGTLLVFPILLSWADAILLSLKKKMDKMLARMKRV